jgi:hypothetical protein
MSQKSMSLLRVQHTPIEQHYTYPTPAEAHTPLERQRMVKIRKGYA